MSEEDREGPPPYLDLRRHYGPQGLGDLPKPLGVERGERDVRDPQGRVVPGEPPGQPGQVADLARGTGIKDYLETHRVPRVAPPLNFEVASVYDSRPVQGTDFQATGCDSLVFAGSPATFPAVSFTFTVPENKIAVLRGFRYQISPQPINIVTEGFCWLQSDLFDNDAVIKDYSGMILPLFMRELFPIFAIIDERHRLRLTLSQESDTVLTGDMAGEILGVQFALYGNLILKTGIPKEFQIANPIPGGGY